MHTEKLIFCFNFIDIVNSSAGCLECDQTNESAVAAINAIVTKGMDAKKKLALTSALCLLLEKSGTFAQTVGDYKWAYRLAF